MRIDGTGRMIAANRQAGASKSSGQVFSPYSAPPQARATQTAAAGQAGGIDALLALQAVDDATTGRRKAIKRASQLLDALEDIKADLLAGPIGEGRLNRAVALLQQAKGHVEPALEAVIGDIELRVRVELAKLGKYPPL